MSLRFIFRFVVVVLMLISLIPLQVVAETVDEKEARLQAELVRIEQEQRETEEVLRTARGQTASLQRDLTIINANIKSAKLRIEEKNIKIERLGKDINGKQETIQELTRRIERGRDSLSQMMRKTYKNDDQTFIEIALSGEDMSDVFEETEAYTAIQKSLRETFNNLKEDKNDNEREKNILSEKRNLELDARMSIEAEKREIERNEKEKNNLLLISKNKEKTYSDILKEKQQKAAAIRAALFLLRDSEAIPFGDALEYAKEASKNTGVRPAFVLAILTQESALGKNVGSCYVSDSITGAGIGAKTGNTLERVMHPTRDLPIFNQITKSLGLDPKKTLVSCPQSIGWGGAMGPAQFIPSTWNLYVSRLSKALKISVPNPWEPKHAFTASAMFLSDLGAGLQTYSAERNAACKYYSGVACGLRVGNSAYGDQVMSKAINIEENMIKPLSSI